jgi:hypothetical protein
MAEKKQFFAIAYRRSQSEESTATQEAFLTVTEDSEDDLGFITRKRGFMPISLEKAEIALKAAQEGTRKFVLGNRADNQNLYSVQMLTPAAAEQQPSAPAKSETTLEH